MDKFLEAYDLQKLNQEDISHQNRSITSNETAELINSFPTKKAQEQMYSQPNSNGTLKKN
jgi:hypothetical protein